MWEDKKHKMSREKPENYEKGIPAFAETLRYLKDKTGDGIWG